MYIYLSLSLYTHIYIYIYIHTCVYMYISLSLYTYIYIYTRICRSLSLSLSIYLSLYIYIYTYTHTRFFFIIRHLIYPLPSHVHVSSLQILSISCSHLIELSGSFPSTTVLHRLVNHSASLSYRHGWLSRSVRPSTRAKPTEKCSLRQSLSLAQIITLWTLGHLQISWWPTNHISCWNPKVGTTCYLGCTQVTRLPHATHT